MRKQNKPVLRYGINELHRMTCYEDALRRGVKIEIPDYAKRASIILHRKKAKLLFVSRVFEGVCNLLTLSLTKEFTEFYNLISKIAPIKSEDRKEYFSLIHREWMNGDEDLISQLFLAPNCLDFIYHYTGDQRDKKYYLHFNLLGCSSGDEISVFHEFVHTKEDFDFLIRCGNMSYARKQVDIKIEETIQDIMRSKKKKTKSKNGTH